MEIFTDPMASGGGLTDLILRCLVLEEPNIYHDSGVFYKEVGRLWKESAPELMGVKLFLELVRLVLLKKFGNDSFIH